MDVREKLVELIAQKVCDAWSESCDEWLPHDCGKCYANDCHISEIADHLISNGVTVQEWISVNDRLPQNFVSVLGYMTDAGEFPPVRECYTVGNAFFFPALGDVHPVSHWREMPKPPKGE